MFVRRVGPLVSPFAAMVCLGLAGQAAAATAGDDPYDPKNIRADIKLAPLEPAVDLVSRNGLHERLKASVLAEARVLYAA